MSQTPPVVVIAYCPQKSENAGRPGHRGMQHVQLNAIRPAQLEKDEKDPNAAHFVDASGGLQVTMSGVSDKTAAAFRGGGKYEITIREIE